jgi:hypothetical protein
VSGDDDDDGADTTVTELRRGTRTALCTRASNGVVIDTNDGALAVRLGGLNTEPESDHSDERRSVDDVAAEGTVCAGVGLAGDCERELERGPASAATRVEGDTLSSRASATVTPLFRARNAAVTRAAFSERDSAASPGRAGDATGCAGALERPLPCSTTRGATSPADDGRAVDDTGASGRVCTDSSSDNAVMSSSAASTVGDTMASADSAMNCDTSRERLATAGSCAGAGPSSSEAP